MTYSKFENENFWRLAKCHLATHRYHITARVLRLNKSKIQSIGLSSNEMCHIEVAVTKLVDEEDLRSVLLSFISELNPNELRGRVVDCKDKLTGIGRFVEAIAFDNNFQVPFNPKDVQFNIFRIHDRPFEVENLETDVNDGFDDIPACNHWLIPSKEFLGLWENLVYEDGLKENMLSFMETALKFSHLNVNPNIISCNRLILLHGPAGTGKTSLCKALAQKASIRLLSQFKHAHLIEINSHSLFSKWFSESGKLVMKLFCQIRELLCQPGSLVFVLIDEVESLAYARSSMSGNEPRDALRVVNAVLTQLDQIKNYSNVMTLATSNLTSTIDLAFLDRVDIKQYIGTPNVKAIYDIYRSAFLELIRVGILPDTTIYPLDELELMDGENENVKTTNSLSLKNIAKKSVGLSGRTLKKLPFLAHAYFRGNKNPTTEEFILSLEIAIKNHIEGKKIISD